MSRDLIDRAMKAGNCGYPEAIERIKAAAALRSRNV
jgi:hypothetical protein